MIHLFTIIVWVFGLLGVVVASPIAQSPSSDDIELPEYTNSLQLVFGKLGEHHEWHLWRGPRGIAVDMCYDNRFQLVWTAQLSGAYDVNNPPWPVAAKVALKIGGRDDCWYISDGQRKDAGHLQCGEDPFYLWYDLKDDPQRHTPTEFCGNGLWHRAYYVEY